MFTLPYRTLIHQKRWATNGLHAVIAENIDRVPGCDQLGEQFAEKTQFAERGRWVVVERPFRQSTETGKSRVMGS